MLNIAVEDKVYFTEVEKKKEKLFLKSSLKRWLKN